MKKLSVLLVVLFALTINVDAQKYGTLDRAIKNCDKSWNSINDFPENQQAEMLEKVDSLSFLDFDLKKLPESVASCKNLKSINLIGNGNIDWNQCFSILEKLENLSEVKISIKKLSNIPSKYHSMITGIGIDYVQGCAFPEILTDILKLKQLTYLDFGVHHSITFAQESVPEELYNLTNLEYLNLSFMFFTELSPNIGNLKQLKTLTLFGNQLSKLPSEFTELTKLEYLDIEYSGIQTLPDNFDKLTELKHLSVSIVGSTKELAENILQISKLKKLKYLELDVTAKNLPAEIGKLTNISILKISSIHDLESLPKEIGNLTNLKELYLDELYSFNDLPKEIGNLTNLEILELDLVENIFFTKIPKEIENLKNLKVLKFAGCYSLKKFPLELSQLPKLEKLYLISTNISDSKIEKIKKSNPNCEIITEY